MPKSTSFVDQLDKNLAKTPKALQQLKSMFFVKGIILIILPLLLFFTQIVSLSQLIYIFAGFMVLDGLVMIASALMSDKVVKTFQNFGLIVGGLVIILGVLPVVFPNIFGDFLGNLIIIGIALDALFTMACLLFVVDGVVGKSWSIVAGLISIVFLIGFFCYAQNGTVAWWLESYALAQGIFYCATPLLFAQAGKSEGKKTKRSKK